MPDRCWADSITSIFFLLRWIWHTAEDVVPGLAEQAAAPFAEWGSQLERETYRLYGVPFF